MADDNLFGESSSDDTDDLFASAKAEDKPKPIAKKKAAPKKKRLQKKKRKLDVPDADNGSDDDVSLSGGKGGDSDGGGKAKKKASKLKKKARKSSDGGGKMSKKEKMEALARKRYIEAGGEDEMTETIPRTVSAGETKGDSGQYESVARAEKNYDSEPSYDSDDSIDAPEAICDDDLPENPIMAAVHRMKRKKKASLKPSEMEDVARAFLKRMATAADEDDTAIQERRPATKKLAMLPEVIEMLTKRDMIRALLDFELLMMVKRWIQPLPNGTLGNVTVRQQLLDAIAKIGTGDDGIKADDLKRSSLGKVVMSLYMHKSETPQMKRQHKALIEQWSRPIFKKSGDMKELERVHTRRGDMGLASIARANATAGNESVNPRRRDKDLTSIIAGKGSGAQEIGNNRVRVPFSKGFQFTVRPRDRVAETQEKKSRPGRDALKKRMLEKSRPVSKNQRSANLSVEGRPTK
mmetsp:Transcript_19425/g.26668  ORF Transcript_19425/g.26668 Transcript_19425/m.26668 type:complete len:465 (-) Transcript_19425:164-1558(-)|eukprot:CAMPEP_0185738142 /NCGR_PEP_ID=MMETSP1171-20130828/32131_1 /TAXON_ID=374046 /ORGANISM="Helicotheca tamensis, Strain CCMP826" /LENGTH=464 /DNA_ID=CAMNT_0028409261 /DNA_START=29 /DNA_END=1423 /DNA_ORIENTATION=+